MYINTVFHELVLSTIVTLAIGTLLFVGCKDDTKSNEVSNPVEENYEVGKLEESNEEDKLVMDSNKLNHYSWQVVYITSEQIRRSHASTETFQFPSYPKSFDISENNTWLLFRISTSEIDNERWIGNRINAGFLIPKPESQVDADWIIANGVFWNSCITLSGILYDFGNEAVVQTENCTQWITDDVTWLDNYNDDLPKLEKADWKQVAEDFREEVNFHPHVHICKYTHLQEISAGYLTFGINPKISRYVTQGEVYSGGCLFRNADELRALLLLLTKDNLTTLAVTIETPPTKIEIGREFTPEEFYLAVGMRYRVAPDVWGPFSESDSSVEWLFK